MEERTSPRATSATCAPHPPHEGSQRKGGPRRRPCCQSRRGRSSARARGSAIGRRATRARAIGCGRCCPGLRGRSSGACRARAPRRRAGSRARGPRCPQKPRGKRGRGTSYCPRRRVRWRTPADLLVLGVIVVYDYAPPSHARGWALFHG